MKFTKPPLSIEDQIALLLNRGMQVPDSDVAKGYLNHINYYRLRAYWLQFEVKAAEGAHQFREGVTFDQVVALYDFDRRLRMLVLDAVERIEVSLRTRTAHTLSMKYGSHAQMDASLFKAQAAHLAIVAEIEKELERSKETFVQHYLGKYTEPSQPPIWAITEITSLGTLSKLYESLKLFGDRKNIARAYDLGDTVLESFLHHLTTVRNTCAHHCRLWNRRFVVRFKLPKHPVYLEKWFNPAADQHIYNTIVMLWFLLRRISPESTWLARARELMESCPAEFEGQMGFPAGWRDMNPWK